MNTKPTLLFVLVCFLLLFRQALLVLFKLANGTANKETAWFWVLIGLPPIEWVWPGKIPRGLLTVLGASQGSGKSFMATDLAWRITNNQGFPDGAPIKRPWANVIYVDAEVVPQILNERALHYGLERGKLFPLLAEPAGSTHLN